MTQRSFELMRSNATRYGWSEPRSPRRGQRQARGRSRASLTQAVRSELRVPPTANAPWGSAARPPLTRSLIGAACKPQLRPEWYARSWTGFRPLAPGVIVSHSFARPPFVFAACAQGREVSAEAGDSNSATAAPRLRSNTRKGAYSSSTRKTNPAPFLTLGRYERRVPSMVGWNGRWSKGTFHCSACQVPPQKEIPWASTATSATSQSMMVTRRSAATTATPFSASVATPI